MFKKVVEKISSVSLILKILIGLCVGILLYVLIPGVSFISLLGTIFIGALKAIAPILVFFLVASSISQAKKGLGKRFATVIFLYIFSTLLAAVTAVILSFIFPVSIDLQGISDSATATETGNLFENIITGIIANPLSAIIEANYISVLFWAVVFGFCLKKVANEKTLGVISDVSDAVSMTVKIIINFAPIGIMGIIYKSLSENGFAAFVNYGKVLALLVGCMLTVALVVNPIIASVYLRRNAYPLVLKCLKESGLTAFFTRSSAANIPVNMGLCERLGLDKDFYSVSIPLGSTINMDGAAVTITVMALAVCNTVGVSVSLPTAILLSVVATFGACGASGVAGGSLLLIPMACSLFGISNDIAMQAVAVGFIIGVVQDSIETALNSSGDVLFTATAEYSSRRKLGKDMHFLGK